MSGSVEAMKRRLARVEAVSAAASAGAGGKRGKRGKRGAEAPQEVPPASLPKPVATPGPGTSTDDQSWVEVVDSKKNKRAGENRKSAPFQLLTGGAPPIK